MFGMVADGTSTRKTKGNRWDKGMSEVGCSLCSDRGWDSTTAVIKQESDKRARRDSEVEDDVITVGRESRSETHLRIY